MNSLRYGVNLVGHFKAETGLGEGVRATARSLREANVPHTCIDLEDNGSQNPERFTTVQNGSFPINLIQLNPPTGTDWLFRNSSRCYQIGYWAWEQSLLPPAWANKIQHFDEIWVPSEFTRDAVKAVTPQPVFRAPHSISTEISMPSWAKSNWGIPESEFVFINCFDFRSYIERKNPEGLIESFSKAFSPHDGVTLIIKTNHGVGRPEFKHLKHQIRSLKNIRILDETLTHAETLAWINASDAYVSLHRSEGFGLPLFEAMSLGKPVVATGYSGMMDYLDSSNALLVNFTLKTPLKPHPLYWENIPWADPDLDHATKQMQLLVENCSLFDDLSLKGKEIVETQLSARVVGERMKHRLMSIAETINLESVSWQALLPKWSENRSHTYGRSKATRYIRRELHGANVELQNTINQLMSDRVSGGKNGENIKRFRTLNETLTNNSQWSWKKQLKSPLRSLINRLVWPYWTKQKEINSLLFEALDGE